MDDCDLPNNCEQNDQGDSGDSGQFSESPNENNYKVHQPRVLGLVLPFKMCPGPESVDGDQINRLFKITCNFTTE